MDIVKLLQCFGCLTGDPSDIVTEVKKRNPELVMYLKSLVGSTFQGETSNVFDNVSDHNEQWNEDNLGSVLYNMDRFIRSKGDNLTGNEHEFLQYIHQAAKHRYTKGQSFKSWHKKMLRDKTRFIELYRRRGTGVSHSLHHINYWATRQQLRAGKVIADWIDKRNGNLDPIFGTLLSPTAGRTGPGDSGWIHTHLFDENGPIAYHSAAHDAFGYLLNFHQTGPGYKYLSGYSMFDAKEPLSDQVSGIEFWSDLLSRYKATKRNIHVY